jgi:putative thioredoxin
MAEQPWISDVDEAGFERDVLRRSRETPVVADFWAPWCGPCRTLGPLLEALAAEHAGAFHLARIDVDQSPRLAQQLGVRSIPTVIGVRDGQVAAEFVGAQPESVVREFLARLLPTQADRLARQGVAALERKDTAEAEARFREALQQDARQPQALLGLARILAERGENDEALGLLQFMPAGSPLADEADRLAAVLRTASQAGGADLADLRERLAADPADLEARLELGRALAATGRYEEALGELLEVVRRDAGFADEAARKSMLDVFEALGSDHELVARFRSELARLLFR